MAIKKLIFRGLKRGSLSYTAIGGIRLYDNNNKLIEFTNPISETIEGVSLDNATIKVSNSFDINFSPFKAFDTSKSQFGNVNSGNYWASTLNIPTASDLTLEFTKQQRIKRISFVPRPASGKTDRGIAETFYIDGYDSSGLLIQTYEVNPITVVNASQSINTESFDIINKTLIRANNNTYSIENNFVYFPTNMTSNTSHAPLKASASSEYTGYQAWNAFSDNTNKWTTNNYVQNGWIQLYCGEKIFINRIYMQVNDYRSADPRNFDILGSNDGVNFDVLKTVTNQTWNYNYETRGFDIETNTKYSYYRVKINSNNGHYNTTIRQIKLVYHQGNFLYELPALDKNVIIRYGNKEKSIFMDNFSKNKSYILQDDVSKNEEGLYTTKLDRKPLSISFK